MKKTISQFAIPMLAAVLALGSGTAALAQGDSGALLDALVRKKVLNAQEAEDIRADLIRDNATTSAGKINLSPSITSLKLYGDLRMRYQWDQKQEQFTAADAKNTAHDSQRSRERFRLRLNADFQLTDNIFGGVQLQTSNAADSGNQTFSGGFGNYNIYISRAFVGWQATPWFTGIIGKQANPFYTTDLVWDADINPDGIVERVDFHKLFGGSGSIAGYSKDGKAIVSSICTETPWELSLIAGQFFYDDNNEFNPGTDFHTDAWLFNTQLLGTYKITSNVKVTFAPGYMTYTAGNTTNLNNETAFMTKQGDTVLLNQASTRHLSIVTAPGDVSFKIAGIKAKVLWDVAYNLEGKGRFNELYSLDIPAINQHHTSQDDLAWLAGIQLGENKKKGDWSVLANFRQTGISAVDPNLNDSDFALGQLNTQGIKAGLAYNFTDACVGAVTYYDAWNLNKDLYFGQATKNQKIANVNSVQILQMDLSVKF